MSFEVFLTELVCVWVKPCHQSIARIPKKGNHNDVFLFSVLSDAGVKQVLLIVLRVLFRFVLLLLTQGQQQRTTVFQSLFIIDVKHTFVVKKLR